MTVPHEALRALKRTRKFLMEIIKMKRTEIRKNPAELQDKAYRCIRHFPFDVTLDEMYKAEIKNHDKMVKDARNKHKGENKR